MSAPRSRVTPYAVAGAVAAICLAVYWSTHGSGPFWQDSGLFLAALHVGGGLLPPGYPAYLLLGRPFVSVFGTALPGHTFAEAGNMFSAVCAALAAGFTSLSIFTLLEPGYRFFEKTEPARRKQKSAPENEPRARWLAAALGGLLAGLSYSLWFQALTAEAYALNACFAAAVVFFAIRLGQEGPISATPTRRQWRFALLLLATHGLSCGNHPVTIVFVPAIAWLAFTQRAALRNRRFLLATLGIYAATALAPYAYLPWAAAAHPEAPYGSVGSAAGLVAQMLGTQWSAQGQSYGFSRDRFTLFPVQLAQELLPVGILGLLLGLRRLLRDGKLATFFAWIAVPATLLPLLYLRGGEYDFWLLPLYMLLFVVAGVGIGTILEALRTAERPRMRSGAQVALVTLGVAMPVAINGPLVNRRGDFVAEDFGRNLYRHLEPNAMFIAMSDQENALTYYLETVERQRPDVIRIDGGVVTTPWFREQSRRRYPALYLPEGLAPEATTNEWLAGLVDANVAQRPVYLTSRPDIRLPPGTDWLPAGGLWKLTRTGGTVDVNDWEYTYRNERPFDRPARNHAPMIQPDGSIRRQPYTEQVRRFHIQAWINLGDYGIDSGRPDVAVSGYEKALALDPALDQPGVFFGLGKGLFLLDRFDEAGRYLERADGRLGADLVPETALYLGQIHARRQDWAGARREYDRIKRAAPALWPEIEAGLAKRSLLPPP